MTLASGHCCECGAVTYGVRPWCSTSCELRAFQRSGALGVRRLLAAVALGSAAVGLLVMVAALLSTVVR